MPLLQQLLLATMSVTGRGHSCSFGRGFSFASGVFLLLTVMVLAGGLIFVTGGFTLVVGLLFPVFHGMVFPQLFRGVYIS
jgi:hypothetical protein